jgi:hypothetical protein
LLDRHLVREDSGQPSSSCRSRNDAKGQHRRGIERIEPVKLTGEDIARTVAALWAT